MRMVDVFAPGGKLAYLFASGVPCVCPCNAYNPLPTPWWQPPDLPDHKVIQKLVLRVHRLQCSYLTF